MKPTSKFLINTNEGYMTPKELKDRYTKEELEGLLSFFTTKQYNLYPNERGLDCGPCKLYGHPCRLPCMTSETPMGVGMVSWQEKPDMQVIRLLREALELNCVDINDEYICGNI